MDGSLAPQDKEESSQVRSWPLGILEGRRVSVTGGAGFIGSHLVDRLIEKGAEVTPLDDLSFGHAENVNRRAALLECDVTDFEKLQASIGEAEVVFHLAANATTKESSMGWGDPLSDYRINAMGTLSVLDAAARRRGRVRVVYASSAAVYGIPHYVPMDEGHPTSPLSPYGVSKLAGEKYCWAYQHERGLDVTSARIFNTYGPRQPRYVMYDLVKKLLRDPDRLEVLGDGNQVRDYCYVSDTVEALILLAEKGPAGAVFNVASGEAVRIHELVSRVVKTMGLESRTDVRYTGQTWMGDIPTLLGDPSALGRLGFAPSVTLAEGLSRLCGWLQERPGAVGDERCRKDTGSSSLYKRSGSIDAPLDVETVTLDAFFAGEGWPPIDFVKMDIEGAEESALKGMASLSARNPRLKLIVEFNTECMDAAKVCPEALLEVLRNLGFTRISLIAPNSRLQPIGGEIPRLVRKARGYPCNLLCEKPTASKTVQKGSA